MSFKIVTRGDFGLSSSGVRIVDDRLDLADELQEQFHEVAKGVAKEAAGILLAEVQRLLRLRAGTFKSAAPEGQPPEYDIGELYRSFEIIPPRVKGRTASSGVQSDHPGANRLEYGKTDARGIRTLPHPFVRPAMANVEEAVTELVQKRLGT